MAPIILESPSTRRRWVNDPLVGGYTESMIDSEKSMGIVGGIVGVVVTPIAVIAAMISGGAGHGDYVAAQVLYPVPILLSDLLGDFSLPLIVLALAQFPMYGVLGGSFWLKGLIWILVIHFIAVTICFSGFVSGFS